MTLNLFDGISTDWSFDDRDGLKNYLDEVWQNRPFFLVDEEEEEAKRSTAQRFFDISRERIKARNYIGFVQYGDLRINVYPRVFYSHPDFNVSENSMPAIQHVLKWLSYGNRIHFPFSEVPLQLQSPDDWLEALIFLFANYTSDILSNSPYFSYQEVTEEMSFVRGRIAMQPYINQNLARGRHHLLHCTYEPFLYDNQFNRIVKHTCRVLQAATSSNHNRYLLDSILFLLDEVTDIYCSSEDCAKVAVNRLYPGVNTITNMCAAFLSNQAYSDGNANKQNLCILLPMEVIYEQYVAGFIQQHLPDLDAIPQASDKYVALTGENFSKEVFRMKHDIMLPGKLIIDTKYKFRIISDDLKGDVNQGDLYQMVTYCFKRDIKSGLLLYPYHSGDKAENATKKFKVEDILITASSIDTTEGDIDNFTEFQEKKFREIFDQH